MSTVSTDANNPTCLASCSSKFTILGNLVGLAVIAEVTSGGDPFINLASFQASVWDDQCGYMANNLFATTILNQTIDKGDAPLTLTYSTHPALKGCLETITVSYQLGVNIVSQPSWIAYDQVTGQFTVSPPIDADINKTFTVTITASA